MDSRIRVRLQERLVALKILGRGIPVRTPARGVLLSTGAFLDKVPGLEHRLDVAGTEGEFEQIEREIGELEGQARNVPVRYAHARDAAPGPPPETPPKRTYGLMRLKKWTLRYEPWVVVWEQTPDGLGSYRVTSTWLKSTCFWHPDEHLVPEECHPSLGAEPTQPIYADPVVVTYDNLSSGDAFLDYFNPAKVFAKREYWQASYPLGGYVNPHRWYTGNINGVALQSCPGDPFLGGPYGHLPRHYQADNNFGLTEPPQRVMDDQKVMIGHVDTIHKFAINPADYPDDTHVKIVVRVVENGSGYFPDLRWHVTGGYTTAEIYANNEWNTFGGLLNTNVGGPTVPGDDPGAWYGCTDKVILPDHALGTIIIEKPEEMVYVGISLAATMSQPPGHPDIYSIQHWYGERVTDPPGDWSQGYRGYSGTGAYFWWYRPTYYPWERPYDGQETRLQDICFAEGQVAQGSIREDYVETWLSSLSELTASLETTVEGYTPA